MGSSFATAEGDEPLRRVPEFRVFIASTFRDIQASREFLVRSLFPELRAMCSDRRMAFSESNCYLHVDGDLEDQYNAIISRRPFFVGIFNDEPGDDNDHERNRVIQLTEKVLKNLTLTDHAVFYLHRQSKWANVPAFDSRLRVLIDHGRQCGVPVRGPFPGPKELGESIARDLRGAIDRFHLTTDRLSRLEHERRIHQEVAARRRGLYLENADMIRQLDEVADGSVGPVVVSGESGAGKSSLLAYWSHRYRAAHPDALVIEHYVGGASAGDHISILRRIMAEIKVRFGVDTEIPATAAEVEQSLSTWLANVQGTSIVLVIDALDRLDEDSRSLTWLPDYFQPNVRLIVSTLEGPVRDTLHARGWREILVQPLDRAQRRALMRRALDERGDALDKDMVVERFLADPRFANPLFLWIGIEELAARQKLADLYERIDFYLGAGGLDELFDRALEEREKVFGEIVVRDVMSALWASRRGLSVEELEQVCGKHRQVLHSLLHSLHYSLMERGGLLTFFHDSLRDVVKQRYLRGSRPCKKARQRLAGYFNAQPVSSRMADELLWQLREAEDWAGLGESMSRLDLLLEFSRNENEFELLKYWLEIGDRLDMADTYCRQLEQFSAGNRTTTELFVTYFEVARFLLLDGRRGAAETLLLHAHALADELQGESVAERVRILNTLGELYQSRSEHGLADDHFRRALALCRRHYKGASGEAASTLHNMAALRLQEGNLDQAIELFEQVVDLQNRIADTSPRQLAGSLNDLGAAWHAKGNLPRAEARFNEALRIVESVCGVDHPGRIEVLNNIATIHSAESRLDDAEKIFTEVLRVSERAFGPWSSATATYINNLAYLKKQRGQPEQVDEAERLYLRALAIDRRNNMLANVTNELISLGSLYRSRNDFEQAEKMLMEAVEIPTGLFGAEHIVTARSALNLASLYKAWGKYQRSQRLYHMYTDIVVRNFGQDHRLSCDVVLGYADLLERMGRFKDVAKLRSQYSGIFPADT